MPIATVLFLILFISSTQEEEEGDERANGEKEGKCMQ